MADCKLQTFTDRETLNQAVADLLATAATSSAEMPGIMLSGGSTPFPAYERLAATSPPVAPTLHLMFTDDRLVSPNSPDSNYGNTRPLIESLGLPPSRVLHVRSQFDLPTAAVDYAGQLEQFLRHGGSIELGLLGLGADGHTCSLFTHEAAAITNRLAFAVPGQAGFDRITVSRAVLLRTRRLVLMAAGESKADIVREFLENPMDLPAGSALAGHPEVELWTDQTVQ